MEKNLKNKEELIFKILDFIFIVCVLLLSIKKGGFYKEDSILFNFVTLFVAFIYIAIKIMLKRINFKKIDIPLICLIIIGCTYLFPIIFENFSSLNDSFFEFIRYFNVIAIYLVVKNSNSKKLYINGLIIIAIVMCLFGIDGISARCVLEILRKFDTGYLSVNLDRMSGTIQYANTFGVIIVVCSMIFIKKIDSFSKKSIIKFSLSNIILYLFISSIILTSSRYLMLIYLVFLILIIYKYIENKALISISIISNILLAFFMSAFILSNIGDSKIYIIYLIFFAINSIISLGIYLIFSKLIKGKVSKKSAIVISVCLVLAIVIYIVLNSCIFKSIKLNESNNLYEAYIYGKSESEYDIKIDFKESENFSIDVNIYEVLKDDTANIIKSYNYTDINKEDHIQINNYKFSDDFKCIKINFILNEGKINIDKLSVNNKNVALSYYLIPYSFITRFFDSINGSNSTSLRLTYIKDALKISTSSIKNFLFGCGGEAFKNMYNSVKEKNYISSEVHSSFIQILIEGGIFAFASITCLIIYIIFKAKNNEIKLIALLLVAHSIFDLNFSYMITLAIFAVLLALLEYKENDREKNVRYLNLLLYILVVLSSLILSIISLFAFASNKMSINVDTENDINILERKLDFAYKKYYLDKFEYENIKKIVLLKENHISLLRNDFKDENIKLIKNDINDINNFLLEIRRNNKYNKEAIYFVCEKYYDNIENFAYVFYENDLENAKKEYIKVINELLEDLRNKYKIHESTNKKIDYLEKIYK